MLICSVLFANVSSHSRNAMLMFFVSFHVSMMCYAVLLCIVLRVNVVVSFRMWMLWRANRFCFVPCVNAVACMRARVRARMLAWEG